MLPHEILGGLDIPENKYQPHDDGFVKIPSAALRCILGHCGVQEVRLIPSDLRALHLKLFTVPSDFQLFTASSHDIVGIKLLGINDV